MQNTSDSVSYILRAKLVKLVSFLSKLTEVFDLFAEEIDDTDLKTAVLATASESRQHAMEISHRLHELNMPVSMISTDNVWEQIEESISSGYITARGGEIAILCNNCETYVVKLYEEVLEEFPSRKNLKDILTYQLFAVKCAFMRIRLLNDLRFNYASAH